MFELDLPKIMVRRNDTGYSVVLDSYCVSPLVLEQIAQQMRGVIGEIMNQHTINYIEDHANHILRVMINSRKVRLSRFGIFEPHGIIGGDWKNYYRHFINPPKIATEF